MYYFINAEKDATVYSLNPDQNTGLDEILEVSKNYVLGSKNISRALIKFDFTYISSVLNDIELDRSAVSASISESLYEVTQSLDSATGSVEYYSSSYHVTSGSLYDKALLADAEYTELNNLISESNQFLITSYNSISQSVVESVIQYESSGTYEELTGSYNELYDEFEDISGSYDLLISSSVTGSLTDAELYELYNETSQSLIELENSVTASLIQSRSVFDNEKELELLESNISGTLYDKEQIESSSIEYELLSGSVYTLTSQSLYATSSWQSYESQSNYLRNIISSLYDDLIDAQSKTYNPTKFELVLTECEASEIPINYTLYAYPVSQSWEMGIGTKYDEISTDGVTWWNRTTDETWITSSLWDEYNYSSSLVPQPTGSYWVPDKLTSSVTYWDSPAASQSFDYQSANIEMNITNIFNEWDSGNIENYGIVLKHTGSIEADTTDYGELKFFSRETNTIYQPKLRCGVDDVTFNTGSLPELIADDIHVSFKRLKKSYTKTSEPKIEVVGREMYPLKNYNNQYAYTDKKYLPETTYYQIRDAITDEIILPFSDYTKVSCDEDGNYFKLNFMNWETNREYYIEIKVERSDGSIEYFSDDDMTFVVEE